MAQKSVEQLLTDAEEVCAVLDCHPTLHTSLGQGLRLRSDELRAALLTKVLGHWCTSVHLSHFDQLCRQRRKCTLFGIDIGIGTD